MRLVDLVGTGSCMESAAPPPLSVAAGSARDASRRLRILALLAVPRNVMVGPMLHTITLLTPAVVLTPTILSFPFSLSLALSRSRALCHLTSVSPCPDHSLWVYPGRILWIVPTPFQCCASHVPVSSHIPNVASVPCTASPCPVDGPTAARPPPVRRFDRPAHCACTVRHFRCQSSGCVERPNLRRAMVLKSPSFGVDERHRRAGCRPRNFLLVQMYGRSPAAAGAAG